MKKLKAKVPNSKASRQGARLCPPGTIASSFKEKQLKQIQERRRLILQDEEDEAHESQSTRQHQGTKQIVGVRVQAEQHGQEKETFTSTGSVTDYLRLKKMKQERIDKQKNSANVDEGHGNEVRREQAQSSHHAKSASNGSVSAFLASKQTHQLQQPQESGMNAGQPEGQPKIGSNSCGQLHENNIGVVGGNTAVLVEYEANTTSDLQASTKKKTRGLTMLKDLQTRQRSERQPIILNEKHQPVGPDEKTMISFSGFLGTIARKPNLAPLNYVNWREMPTKDQIWEFVNTVFVVPEEGKSWVLKSVGESWRTFKHRVKENHYTKYKTDEERRQHRPDFITEDIFTDLLEYWSDDNVKKMAEVNRGNRIVQKNPHTVGRKSFARLYNQIHKEKGNDEPLSIAEMFVATRKRKVGKLYKQPDDVSEKIARLEKIQAEECNGDKRQLLNEIVGDLGVSVKGRVRLYGRGVKKSDLRDKGASSKPSFIVPGDCIESIKQSLEEEMQQKLAVEKAAMEKQMEEQMDKKLQLMQQNMFSQFVMHLRQANHGLNINNDTLGSLFSLPQSPGDALSAPNQLPRNSNPLSSQSGSAPSKDANGEIEAEPSPA